MTFKRYILETKAPESHLGDEHEEDEIKFNIDKLLKLLGIYLLRMGTATTLNPEKNLNFHYFEISDLEERNLFRYEKEAIPTGRWKKYEWNNKKRGGYISFFLLNLFVDELKKVGFNYILNFNNNAIYFSNREFEITSGMIQKL